MFHINRALFVCFLMVALAFALVRYAAPGRLHVFGNRMMPNAAMEAARNPPAENMPTSARVRRPVIPMPGDPVFTVDIEQIPEGMTARGTSFPLGNGLWLTARHVVSNGCAQIILIVDGANVRATVRYEDPNADLAVLATPTRSMPSLPIEAAEVSEDQNAFAFGFPSGALGATEGRLIGRATMKLGGRLDGMAPVLTWAEISRYPDSLDSLSGISGGPMLDDAGNVVGIIVAASAMRGRNYTVAPEILHAVQHELGLDGPLADQMPAQDAVTPPVVLNNSAALLSKNARIAKTYCIPE